MIDRTDKDGLGRADDREYPENNYDSKGEAPNRMNKIAKIMEIPFSG